MAADHERSAVAVDLDEHGPTDRPDDDAAEAGRRRSGPPAEATRAAVLAAAERLFAERGIYGVSLREIAEAAGQRNNAAVHYHFGGREELIRTLFERRFIHLDNRRRTLLEELDAAGKGDDLVSLVRVLVVPFTESMDQPQGGHWARLVAKMHQDPRFNPFAVHADHRHPYSASEETTAATRELAVRIQESLDLDYGLAMARFFIVITMVVHSVADRAALVADGSAALTGPSEDFAERLVRASVAILRGVDA